ncbi:MAG: PTS system mannose/fructose/sorbose family transporter subunit IID [Candidatus Eisenbacteria bacterium]|nr:PTS system mannose/fructose/sorbose family transporter subunit IID [Candidatus Eisenbacteria bacterium]
MSRISRMTLFMVGFRAHLLQAVWNFERQQGIGWAFALAPVLERLYPDRATRTERLAEHTAYFNTQPTLASFALGAAARVEEARAAGQGDAASMARLKSALGSTYAALGDRLFWFTLRPFAAACGVLLALTRPQSMSGALVLWLVYALPHVGLRAMGVLWGYEQGPGVLSGAFRERLEWVVRVLGVLGCAVLGVVFAWSLAPGGEPRPIAVQCALAGGLGLGLLTAQRARPSPTRWALVLGILGLWLALRR